MGKLEEVASDDMDNRLLLLKQTSWTGDMLGTHNWMNPGIETYSGKNLFDPCPVGWVMPDANTFFGEVSTDTEVDYLEAIYSSSAGGIAEYYFATLMLYDIKNPYEFVFFPASGSRSGVNGKGPEGNIWKVGKNLTQEILKKKSL